MKRLKGKNFSDNEIHLIIDIIEKYIKTIENKKTDGASVKDKNDAWLKIAQEFNANSCSGERSAIQLKNFYDNFKRKKRKDNADDKAELYKTGGGSFIKKIDASGERLIGLLKEQFEPDENIYDSASKYHDTKNQNVNTFEHGTNVIEDITNEENSPNLLLETEKKNEESENNIIQDEIKPKYKNSNLANKQKKTATTVYNALETLTNSKTLKKNYEKDYLQLKFAYKSEQYERKKEENKEARELFLLQKQKLENDLKLQEIKIQQELILLEEMKKK